MSVAAGAGWLRSRNEEFATFNRTHLGVASIELDESASQPSLMSTPFGRCRLTEILSPPSRVRIVPTKDPAADTVRMLIQIEGETSIEHESRSETLARGSILLYDATHTCLFVSPHDTFHLMLHIPRQSFPDSMLGDFRRPMLMTADTPGLAAVGAAYVRAIYEQRAALDAACRSRMDASLIDLIKELLNSRRETLPTGVPSLETLRVRVADHIEKNLDKHLDVAGISASMGCSARYLHKAFEHQGTTLSRFIWSLRLDRAYQELVKNAGKRPIASAAFTCGFNSYSHFSRAFKEKFGHSPTDVIRSLH